MRRSGAPGMGEMYSKIAGYACVAEAKLKHSTWFAGFGLSEA
jgi:hypothetical protein